MWPPLTVYSAVWERSDTALDRTRRRNLTATRPRALPPFGQACNFQTKHTKGVGGPVRWKQSATAPTPRGACTTKTSTSSLKNPLSIPDA